MWLPTGFRETQACTLWTMGESMRGVGMRADRQNFWVPNNMPRTDIQHDPGLC